jgi:ABC-type lipoprotein export system ATPase subunit
VYGVSGSGKSTLLNILGLLDEATSGNYELDHVNVRELSQKQRAKIRNQKIGFVFQAYHLIPELNAIENVAVPLGYAGISKKERQRKARDLLEKFNLEDLGEKYISQMSGGEQQRVAIARSIANDPCVLLADEPTGNLDQQNSRKVMELLKQLNDQGMTIVMVTHDTTLAEYGSRVIYVEDGNVIERQ